MRNRKRITEPEVRSYMMQLAIGLKYIHEKNIVHRDLKLGNLFLGGDMQLKIGDFGLSERINYEGELLNSLSGTPNYIAPEILTKEGHSFGVDVWAVGVIAYTLLFGVPPFQTKTSKATCNRIKQVMYTYPPKIKVTSQCKDFINQCLQKNPADRIKDLESHPFFSMPYPKLCASSTMHQQPKYEEVKEIQMGDSTPQKFSLACSRAKSIANLRRTPKIAAKNLDESEEDNAKENLDKESKTYIFTHQ